MIDTNEVGALIASCQNADYLHHLTGLIKNRLLVLERIAKPPCRNCAGKKTVLQKINGDAVQVPCPKCQIAEPRQPEDFVI